MTELVERHLAEIADLCRRYRVHSLYLFGSAVSGHLRPDSDLDFLVEMADRQPTGSYAQRYLDLADGLEQLFGRRVDLLTEPSVRNPYLRSEIETTRELVYGPALEKAAV